MSAPKPQCQCRDCIDRPSREDIGRVLAEMDRYGVNRGWVLMGALLRFRRGERL